MKESGTSATSIWRPLFWWLLLVVVLFAVRTHQRWMEQTRLAFVPTLEGHAFTVDFVIRLDGKSVGSGDKISLGNHIFTISHPQGDSFETNFFMWYGRRDFGQIKLKRSHGTLHIQASPAAPSVAVSGPEFSTIIRNCGITNLVVPTDQYTIQTEYRYLSETKDATVSADSTASCIIAPQFGSVALTCNKNEATYSLASGQQTLTGSFPVQIDNLPIGTYQLTAAFHGLEIQKVVQVELGKTNDTEAAFELGAGRIESVPSGANVNTMEGRYLGQTPLDLTDMTPQNLSFKLSLLGYQPVVTSLEIFTDRTNLCRTNLVSNRYLDAISEANHYLAASNYEAVLQAANDALGAKPADMAALSLQRTAQQFVDAKNQRLERLNRPHVAFNDFCSRNPDSQFFEEHALACTKSASELRDAIVKSFQVSPAFEIIGNDLVSPDTYQIAARQTFSLGILGGTQRICLLIVGQPKDNESLVLYKVLEYRIEHTIGGTGLLDFKDNKNFIPVTPSKIQMTDGLRIQVQEGQKIVEKRIVDGM